MRSAASFDSAPVERNIALESRDGSIAARIVREPDDLRAEHGAEEMRHAFAQGSLDGLGDPRMVMTEGRAHLPGGEVEHAFLRSHR